MTDLDMAAEYAKVAEAWRAFCGRSGNVGSDPLGESLAVALLTGLCEPIDYSDKFTGDIIMDMIGGLRGFVERISHDAGRGGGGGLFLDNLAIDAWLRKLNALSIVRNYERLHREHLARTMAGAKGDSTPQR